MTTPTQLLEDARRLAAEFMLRGDEIEKARRIPPDVSAAMADAGFYRLAVPAQVGGLEQPPAVGSRVYESLAQGDASCAWVAFIAATSGSSLAQIPLENARELFATPQTHVAGAFAPSGKARLEGETLRVNGTWQWGSGTENADWILGGCQFSQGGEPLLDSRGEQRSHMVLMPTGQIQFLDTWHTSGLRGTGSTHYRAENLEVPVGQAVGFARQTWADGALFRFPMFTFLASGIAAVALGLARASIDELVGLAGAKKRVGNTRTIAEQPTAQATLARAEARLRGARAFYYESLDAAWEAAVQDGKVPLQARRDVRLATNHAVESCVQVVDAMYALGGGSAVYESSRLQRMFRDIHVATQHIMVGPSILETVGRLYFGLESNTTRL